ncbi:hypothetical protein ACFXMT_25595 [Streptomyces mirabilis]|uniref:hypothetical protein n=1 Tax=Streptomyces mirabilis TaxID=68239 RepID=UPI0036BF9457
MPSNLTSACSSRLETESLADADEAARIAARVDAMERAVTGLISEARQRRVARVDAACEATASLRERVAFWTVLAEDTGRAVTLDVAAIGPLFVGVAADELAAALDALLGNVFAHTPDGTGFAVTLAPRAGGGALLTVADDGPWYVGRSGTAWREPGRVDRPRAGHRPASPGPAVDAWTWPQVRPAVRG